MNWESNPQTSDNAPFWELPVHSSDVTDFDLGIRPYSLITLTHYDPEAEGGFSQNRLRLHSTGRLLSGDYLLSLAVVSSKAELANPPPQCYVFQTGNYTIFSYQFDSL